MAAVTVFTGGTRRHPSDEQRAAIVGVGNYGASHHDLDSEAREPIEAFVVEHRRSCARTGIDPACAEAR
jgi:hypothetical protein